jgi:leucyl aminopeptidase (aminopeptidase T)
MYTNILLRITMETKEFSMWTLKNGLFRLAKKIYPQFKRVLKECLKAKDQDVLIVTDTGYEDRQLAPLSAKCYQLAAKEMGLKVSVVAQKPKLRKEDAEKHVIKALDEFQSNNIVILTLSSRLGALGELGKSFRKLMKEKKHRFISTSNIGKLKTSQYMNFVRPIDVDYNELKERCDRVKKILDEGNEIHVTTKAGTDFHYSIKGRKAISNSGIYGVDGLGGNIPAGEVYTAPKGKEGVYGRVVVDGTATTVKGSTLLKNPVVLEIENDEIVEVNDHEQAKLILESLEWAEQKAKHPWGIRRVGEFGIGLNRKAKIVGVTIIDEKSYGTAHIAIGSNYWFGGTVYSIIHLDQIFKERKIEVDGEILNV